MTVSVTSVAAFAGGEVDFLSWEDELHPGGFIAETIYSGISAGTELTFVNGTHPLYRRAWDRQMSLFVDQPPDVNFPIPALGYMEVARVTESDRVGLERGDLVCMAYGHRTAFSAAPHDFFHPLPADLDPLLGIYVALMGPIVVNALLHAAVAAAGPAVSDPAAGVAGRRVVVLGAGAVGLFLTAFALDCGAAEVVVIDRNPHRRDAAVRLGATAFDDTNDDPGIFCKQRWPGDYGEAGAELAFQTRPAAGSLANALRTLGCQGTVIDLAFYTGGAAELRLGEEFHHNNLAIVCAQIGRTPRGTRAAWPHKRLAEITVELLRRRATQIRAECVTSIVPFVRAREVMRHMVTRSDQQTVVLAFEGVHTGPVSTPMA